MRIRGPKKVAQEMKGSMGIGLDEEDLKATTASDGTPKAAKTAAKSATPKKRKAKTTEGEDGDDEEAAPTPATGSGKGKKRKMPVKTKKEIKAEAEGKDLLTAVKAEQDEAEGMEGNEDEV